MTHRERVDDYVRQIAPAGATNREIAVALGIRWPGTVFKATQRLVRAGRIRRERQGRTWVFSALPTADATGDDAAPGAVAADETVVRPDATEEDRAASRGRERLEELLALPDGRAWLLERLRCPCSTEQARAANVTLRCRPLLELLQQDYAACGGVVAAQGRLAEAYNALFRLADDCGIRKVWRADRPGEMRLPLADDDTGWPAKLLRKHIASKRYLKRALAAPRLVRTRVDALLLAGAYVVLVRCADGDALTRSKYARMQSLGGALERRLHRQFFLAAIVDDPEQLAVLDMAHVRWSEVDAWLGRRADGA